MPPLDAVADFEGLVASLTRSVSEVETAFVVRFGELRGAEPDIRPEGVGEGRRHRFDGNPIEDGRQVLIDLLIEHPDAIGGHPWQLERAIVEFRTPLVEGIGAQMVDGYLEVKARVLRIRCIHYQVDD